jgi:hypothetical protein
VNSGTQAAASIPINAGASRWGFWGEDGSERIDVADEIGGFEFSPFGSQVHSLEEMAPGECSPRAAFQVLFEVKRFAFIRKSKVTGKAPWTVWSGGSILTGVVAGEADLRSEVNPM